MLWYTLSHGKCMGLPIIFSYYRKVRQNQSNRKRLRNWYIYFPQSMGTFLPQDSHLMVYFMIYAPPTRSNSYRKGLKAFFLQAISHYMEKDKHLKTFLPSRFHCKNLDILLSPPPSLFLPKTVFPSKTAHCMRQQTLETSHTCLRR